MPIRICWHTPGDIAATDIAASEHQCRYHAALGDGTEDRRRREEVRSRWDHLSGAEIRDALLSYVGTMVQRDTPASFPSLTTGGFRQFAGVSRRMVRWRVLGILEPGPV